MIRIESPANSKFKLWKKVASGQVKKHGTTLVSGRRIAAEVAGECLHVRRRWIVPAGFREPLPGGDSIQVFSLPGKMFAELDVFGTSYPILEVDVSRMARKLPGNPANGMYVVIPAQDPVNVGAIIRTAAGLGAKGVVTLPSCANPFHPRAVRTSAGAVFRIMTCEVDSLALLPARGIALVGLDRGGVEIARFEFPRRFAFVLGEEGRGLDGLEEKDGIQGASRANMELVSLPMAGIESFNVSVAAALAMYEWRTRS